MLGDLEPFPCSHRPVAVPGLTEVIDLGLTASDSCALDGAGVVWCWGVSQSGIFNNELAEPCDLPWLDNPSLQNLSCSSAPVPIAGIDQAISIGSWGGHCAVEHTGSVKCWVAHMGRAPTPVVDVAEASQTDTSCAVTTDGRVHCWWCNDDGQRGDETLGPPQEVGVQSNCEMTSSTVAWPGRATQVTSGYDHACLVDADGSVACWGGNLAGQLGIPSTEPMLCNYGRSCSTVPVRMPGIETAVQVSAGYGFTCVLDAEGVVTCIGLGLNGHIDLPAPARQIAARYGKACAVLTDGRVFCWGGVDGVQQVPFCERDG